MDQRKNRRGTIFENEKALLFFGNKLGLLETMKSEFPTARFHRIRQVHGDESVEISRLNLNMEITADAHWTSMQGVALCIYTADCIPCLVYCNKTNRVAAIHAGWRGVANQIIPKTLKKLMDSGSQAHTFLIYCGPHIVMTSFEVELDVRNQILQTLSPVSQQICAKEKAQSKYIVDLSRVVDQQLKDIGVQSMQISWLRADTKTDDTYHSFRRDKGSSGRNLSLAFLK